MEHLKRYTTLGMGTDQGKTSNFPALPRWPPCAEQRSPRPAPRPSARPSRRSPSVRLPDAPPAKPFRRTRCTIGILVNGADMLEVGLWMPPWFYKESGRDVNEAYVAEMRNMRQAAGLMDISTLGKIDVQGPDAATFLDRVYANGFAKLPVGRARYGVMLRDDGIVFDDGTTTRLAESRFFMTTSTAKAADVLSRLEFLLDTAWPDLRVAVTSVSDEWAAMSIAGPKSRAILAAAFPSLDVSNEALPHMGAYEGEWEGRALRILALTYSSERAYESISAQLPVKGSGAACSKPAGRRPEALRRRGARCAACRERPCRRA